MPTYRFLVAYDGGPFHGFARQDGLPTVQGVIEESLRKVLGAEVAVSVAGRTDAGVHALGQVISFSTGESLEDLGDVTRRLNSLCGPEIAFLQGAEAPEGFDARFSAVARTYEYAVLMRQTPDPFSRHTTWHHPGPLDVPAMRKAGRHLVGEHDFSSFGRVEPSRSPVRTVESVEVDEQDGLVLIRITASSFIQQMVRSIVGTLIKVGEGKLAPEAMEEILKARDRSAAGPVAPPQGLFLVSVSYPDELV